MVKWMNEERLGLMLALEEIINKQTKIEH